MPPSRSALRITEFAAPKTPDCIAIGAILFLYGAGVASASGHFAPGTALWETAERLLPGSAEKLLWVAQKIVPWLALVHGIEAVLFDQLRMKAYGVPRFSALWWKWEISCFIEGLGSWKRIGKVIADKQKRA
ncbi:hypothetical protein VHEMI02986 [[Torrubiella] hemipterigena]|uniref:Uncharacterized protein n=1 Tax=[Torrubiella] hemipterigena TaxID=1531966 RepID=A0A0A1SR67_9HYPO|nr:hypothetical protein VHEMI02986 [[Torrubiella] hemipterigena]